MTAQGAGSTGAEAQAQGAGRAPRPQAQLDASLAWIDEAQDEGADAPEGERMMSDGTEQSSEAQAQAQGAPEYHEPEREGIYTPEPVALASLTAYVQLGADAPNVRAYEATDDPDEHADAILRKVGAEPESLSWRQTGGDDHGDGITSYDYIAEIPDADTLAAFLRWAGVEAGEGTPNLGILTGPEEWGHIPGGMTWNLEGMDWNVGGITPFHMVDVAVFPITVEAYAATFGVDPDYLAAQVDEAERNLRPDDEGGEDA